MLNSLGMGFIFTARDLASAKMQRLERQFTSLDERVTGGTERMTSSFRQLGVGLGIFTAGAAMLAGSFALANAAGKFEQGLAAVGAVTRATTQELGMLRDAAIEAGIRTQFSPDEAVEGLTSLATAGQTATQSTKTLIPVLDLAAGSLGQLGVAQSAEALVGTLNAYGMAASEASGVTDKLLRITQLTNFQTRDFEAGLAKAASSGSVFSQSLDDVLITMGLLRNRNIDASSSATAFREAVRRVGSDSRAQQAVLGAGVDVFDQTTGGMRSIVDIMSDFSRVSADMTEKERNRRVATAFGARGLLAFNSIMNASFTTMRDGYEVTLKGAEAIEALRQEMGDATGTAEQFRSKLLDTFEGQKTLLKGTLQTFAVVLGEPFAQVLKPFVGAVVETLNAILRVFQTMPGPIKKAFAGIVTAVGGFLMLVGGVIAAKATIGLLTIGLQALGISLAGIMTTLLPVILVIGVLGAAVSGLKVAFEKNLGGIGDVARDLWEKVKLFWGGLTQLFEQGGFSGAVQAELGKAENQGLKRFLISIYQVGFRIGQIWEGFKDGFTRSIEAISPVFEDLVSAFKALGDEIGAIFSELSGGVASLPSSDFRSFGAIAGAAIAAVVEGITTLVAVAARVASGIISGFRSMMEYIGPAFAALGGAIDDLKQTWNDLVGNTNDASAAAEASTEGWRSVGETIGEIVGGIVTFIGLVIAGLIKVIDTVLWVVGGLSDIFFAVGTAIGEGLGAVVWFLTEDLPNALSIAWSWIAGFFNKIGAFFSGVAASISSVFRDIVISVSGFFGQIAAFFGKIRDTVIGVIDRIRNAIVGLIDKLPSWIVPDSVLKLRQVTQVNSESSAVPEVKSGASNALQVMPAASDARGRAEEMARFEAGLQSLDKARAQRGETPPFTVNVQVDGETIARASNRASAEMASRGFSPIPVY